MRERNRDRKRSERDRTETYRQTEKCKYERHEVIKRKNRQNRKRTNNSLSPCQEQG